MYKTLKKLVRTPKKPVQQIQFGQSWEWLQFSSMKNISLILKVGLLVGLPLMVMISTGCKHLPTMPDEPIVPIDTMVMVVDTMTMDTTITGEPCDPDVIYFDQQILPLLIGNCTNSGCHNAVDAADGVILNTYQNVMLTADVRPFDLSGSDLYEVITETDPDDRMPQPPNAPLSNQQINLVAQWILQGAENLSCDPVSTSCDTLNVSFSQLIFPIINNNCLGCHSGPNPNGGIDLTTYDNIKSQALNGKLYGAIAGLEGFVPMPLNGNPLPNCQIEQIEQWIEDGAPQN